MLGRGRGLVLFVGFKWMETRSVEICATKCPVTRVLQRLLYYKAR